MARVKGTVVQVMGGVVDVEFPAEQLPGIYEAIEVPHLSPNREQSPGGGDHRYGRID